MTVVVLVKVVLVSGVKMMKITIEITVMMKMMNLMMMMIMNYYRCGDEDGFDISPEDEGDS